MAVEGNVPVVILRENTSVTSGIEVQQKLAGAAIALANILRKTYGPRGLDKMLYKSNGETAVTNDGAKIIAELLIKHPAAKAFVELGNAQESAAGDGVTGCILFAAELMQEAGRLLAKGLHPLVLVEGYQLALAVAIENLQDGAVTINADDNEELFKVAFTAMNGKAAEGSAKHLAEMVVLALTSVARIDGDIERISSEDVLIAKGRHKAISESILHNGIIIEKRIEIQHMPQVLQSAPTVVLAGDLTVEKTSRDAEIEISNPDQLSEFLAAEEELLESKAKLLLDLGAQAIFCSGEIDKNLLHRLVNAGCFVIGGIDSQDLERISGVSSGRLVHHLADLSRDDLGTLASLRIQRQESSEGVGEKIYLTGNESHFATIEVGGSNDVAIEETVRAIHDALRTTTSAISTRQISYGGGHPHASAAAAVRIAAESQAGRERLAMEAFARALEIIPTTLATNARADSLDRLLELRAAIRSGQPNAAGITANGEVGTVADYPAPTESHSHAWKAAIEAACSLLRVDQVISARGD